MDIILQNILNLMGCLNLFNKRNLKWLSIVATIIMALVQLGAP